MFRNAHIEKGAHVSGRSTGIAALLLSGMAGFQIALAAGAPWGAAAWGGANPGVLPRGLRVSSAGSALVYVLLAVAARSTLIPAQLRRRILTVASGGMVVGTVMNLASPSNIRADTVDARSGYARGRALAGQGRPGHSLIALRPRLRAVASGARSDSVQAHMEWIFELVEDVPHVGQRVPGVEPRFG